MKTIEEAAVEYAEKCDPLDQKLKMQADIKWGFIAGANWQKQQSQWINTKERLPEIGEKGYSKEVLLCRPNKYSGKVDVLQGYLHKAKTEGQEYGSGNGIGGYPKTYEQYWSVPAIQLLSTVTYWMPKPEPPKE